jgi:hypothetical protein
VLDAALVAVVLGIAVAAVVNFIQVRGDEQSALPTPPPATASPTATETDADADAEVTVSDALPDLLPLPAELRQAGGIIWWSDTACQVGSVALSSGTVERIPQEHCRLWPAPDGRIAATVTKRRAEVLEGRGIRLFTAEAAPVISHTPGFLSSEIAWNADGAAFAVCIGTRKGTVVDIVTPGAGTSTLADACVPAWLPDGRLAVMRSRPVSIEVGGKRVLGPRAFDALLPTAPEDATRAVSALAAGGGRLAAALVATTRERLLPEAAALAVMTEAGEIGFSAVLPQDRLPTAIGLSPDGSALWYFDAARSNAVLLRLPGGQRPAPFDARWLSWSPDGRYLAAATGRGIVLSRWPGGEEVAVLPVQASDVTWTRSP